MSAFVNSILAEGVDQYSVGDHFGFGRFSTAKPIGNQRIKRAVLETVMVDGRAIIAFQFMKILGLN